MTDEILKRIDALAAKLGVTVNHLWAVLVKEARIEALESIGWGLMWFTFSLYLTLFCKAAWKRDDRNLDVPIAVGAIALVCFLAACYEVSGTVGMILNPEYWALKEVMKAVGK